MKAKHSLKVRLIKPYQHQPYWMIKVYPKGYGNKGLTLAKEKRDHYKASGWMSCLYRTLSQFNSDISLEEIKKYIGQFMSDGRGKKKQSIEKLVMMEKSKRAKVIGYL